MSARTATKKTASKRAAVRRSSYHHGNLKQALIEATLQLIEEGEAEAVTVRAAAKRAGVSSGAPFRHFPNRTALMTAVAEEAMRRFRAEIVSALDKVVAGDALVRLHALGTAYLRWVVRNPTHFKVISARDLIDFQGSESLRRDNQEIQAIMDGLLAEAQLRGLLRADDLVPVPLAARALVYGLARMYIDGHLPQWGVTANQAETAMQAAMALFVDGLRSPAGPPERRAKARRAK
jgi:AcrR family transcriptional regulator